jgi:primosomal replication protein N
VNRYQVIGTLQERQSLRYTPAGVPALDMQIEHLSTDLNGHDATVNLSSVAFGLVAQTLSSTPLGSTLKLDGFLRHSAKSKKLIVQIESFEII